MGESYESLLFQLGDIAYERLWNKPTAPRVMPKVLKAAEAFEQRQLELRELESAMDQEESAFREFTEACEAELKECRAVVARHRRLVEAAEAQAKPVEASLQKKRKDAEAGRASLQKLEARAQEMEAAGEPRAADVRDQLKRVRLDVMRVVRQSEDLEQELNQILCPEEGPAVEGLQARARERDLEAQLEERERGYRQALQELNDLAAAKDSEIRAAKDYFDQAICTLGQEVYGARIADPALAVFYPKLDKVRG